MGRREYKTNICCECKNAFGGCSWTEVDPKTNKIKFQPVPGWTAECSKIYDQKYRGKKRVIETYYIKACPQFVRG